MYAFLPHSLALALHGNDLYVIVSMAMLIVVGAVAFGLWAMRLVQLQNARADDLERNLQSIREESRRRLNFLNAISHDLRTPLNGMTLQTHVIEHAIRSHDDTTLQRAIGDIRNSSALAADILDSLLQYARTELHHNTLSKVNLKELLQQTAEPFRAAAEEKKLAFTLSVPADFIIETDRDKLERIFANLLDNAVKFTAHGSISITATLLRDIIAINITDTGEGIPPAHQSQLFNEFFQANNPSRDARLGLGLGLVVARRLTQQLGGSLYCKSELHKGSTFRVELPTNAPMNPEESRLIAASPSEQSSPP